MPRGCVTWCGRCSECRSPCSAGVSPALNPAPMTEQTGRLRYVLNEVIPGLVVVMP